MRFRTLGKTGLRLSEIGFGAWAIGGNEQGNSYGPTDDRDSLAAVQAALDAGCNFFDTADVYGWGHSESLLGQALEGRREEVLIATKVGGDFYHGGVRMNFDPGYIDFALERSLERLRTDYVDLYQLHNPPLGLLRNPDLYEVMDRLKDGGRIRWFGVSIHTSQEGLAVLEAGRAASLQLPLNIFRQEWLDTIFPELRRIGMGVIAREPLANGFLTGKYSATSTFPFGDIRHGWPPAQLQARTGAAAAVASALSHRRETLAQLALKFCLHPPEVSVVIPGAKTAQQASENAAASDGPGLTKEEVEALRGLFLLNFGQ